LTKVDTVNALEALYTRAPSPASLDKVAGQITPEYAQWLTASRFCVLTTVGPDGTDGSPRGDDGAVVRIVDDTTLWMPDWRGNNRLDSLRNIVSDGRISCMFMVPGSNNVIRVNGKAHLTADPAVTQTFEQGGKHPTTVIVIHVGEVYSQCSRAILRSRIWDGEPAPDLPTMGQILKAQTAGAVDADGYDKDQVARAKKTMW